MGINFEWVTRKYIDLTWVSNPKLSLRIEKINKMFEVPPHNFSFKNQIKFVNTPSIFLVFYICIKDGDNMASNAFVWTNSTT